MPNTFFPEIRCKRLDPDVPLPHYAHDGDAGLDLCATEDVTLLPGESYKMGSGFCFAIPYGFVGLLFPRSGFGSKGLVLKMCTGIIDSPYRGEIGLTLFNNNPTHIWYRLSNKLLQLVGCVGEGYEPKGTIHVKKGERVAQIVIVPVAIATLLEVEELDATDRNEGGFGSTGRGRL